MKDHYKTLEISTQASPQEIKEAYRRMARRYHPDRNEDIHRATAFFQDIQEAYEVLSNPARRRTYDKELRHAGQYQWQKKDQLYSTEQVLKQAASLVKYINTLDGRSINFDALADYILALLSEENILLLQRAADADTNALITKHILYVCESMVSSRLFAEIAERLNRINAANPVLLQELEAGLAQRRAQERRNNMIPYAAIGIVLLIAIIMCLILFT